MAAGLIGSWGMTGFSEVVKERRLEFTSVIKGAIFDQIVKFPKRHAARSAIQKLTPFACTSSIAFSYCVGQVSDKFAAAVALGPKW